MSVFACRSCAAPVRRVRDADLGFAVDVEAAPIPDYERIDTARVVYEHHRRAGWGVNNAPRHRGYPLHYLHTCSV